jgi:ubiquinone/menaquinone biosynthesis C-methylase UbiE
MLSPLERVAYTLGQGARVAWFAGQSLLAARLGGPAVPPGRRSAIGPLPDRRMMRAELRALFERDLANIAAGHYRMPRDLVPPPVPAVRAAARFFRDLPQVARRRRDGEGSEAFRAPPPGTPRLPRYYMQNFHFQTDGWLSGDSARLYDHQVEVLFAGGADAMRRQALVPIHRELLSLPSAGRRLLDVASGTGRFLGFVKDNWPVLPVTALDLSAPYLDVARRTLRGRRDVTVVVAPAEAMPFADASQDIVTCIFLFHELPRRIRDRVMGEIARVLRPGGLFVLLDSLQRGDRPGLDGLLDLFPVAFHEPYFADYVEQDLTALATTHGLAVEETTTAYLSKVTTFRKPPETAGNDTGARGFDGLDVSA